MSAEISQILRKRSAKRLAGWLVAVAVLWPLSSCQSVSQSQTTSLVRVVDASYNAPALDVYVGKTEIAKDVSPGTITNYAILVPGPEKITIDAAGTTKPLTTLTADLQAAQQHSVYITNAGTGFRAKLLTDQATPAPVGDFAVRFLQSAAATGSVNIYFLPKGASPANSKPRVKNLKPGQITGYLDLPNGNYRLVVIRNGNTTPVYTGSSMSYVEGEVRTVLIEDEPTVHQQPLHVVVGDDLN